MNNTNHTSSIKTWNDAFSAPSQSHQPGGAQSNYEMSNLYSFNGEHFNNDLTEEIAEAVESALNSGCPDVINAPEIQVEIWEATKPVLRKYNVKLDANGDVFSYEKVTAMSVIASKGVSKK